MLLPKQSLSQDARKAFGLFINPFDGEVEAADQMFQNPDFRYCREACWQAAAHGRFVAIVGESGAGKTTLLGDLEDRIEQEHKQVVLIRPSVLGMEDNDKAGKTLKATGIMDAIIFTLDPTARPRLTMEAKTRQLQAMLEASAKAGNAHLLVIEEAHCLPVNTLKHLKRLHELRMGRRPLLGILLMGQPEIRKKLNPNRQDLREVVQRCEVVELLPLDSDLKGYITTRLARANKRPEELMDDQAIDAVRHRLTVQTQSRPGDRQAPLVSQVYPLAVNNFMTRVLNSAAELGVPRVTRDVVLAV
ncbi:MAG: AAA family ATPase [Ramlibacter sp.]|nr:AAA family ATPase [Ramlibacter sp.]